MTYSTLEGLSGIFTIQEGLQPEEGAALELTEVPIRDMECLSEVDEVRIRETAAILAEIFSGDVLGRWSEMTLQEKAEKLNAYYVASGANLEIQTKGVILEPMHADDPNGVLMGYNSRDGYIHINVDVVNDPRQLYGVLDTATHEMRHQFQQEVVASPQRFSDLPQEVLSAWDYEMQPGNYIDPNYDFRGYYEQAIEQDARAFSQAVMGAYVDILKLQ